MASPEFNVESVVILILAAQAALPAAKHYDDNTDTVQNLQRLAVKCSPKTIFAPARSLFLAPPVWQAILTIEYQEPTSTAVATWDAAIAAIDSAMTGTPPVAAVTAATGFFPQGMGIDIVNGGDKQTAGNDTRTLTRTYRAWWGDV